MKVAVIGTGFVGVVTAAVFASFGNEVVGLDIDQKKVEQLTASKVPFFEPGLEELLTTQQAGGNLVFTTDYQQAITDAKVVMIAVGTPSREDGHADLKYLYAACDSLAPFLMPEAVVVVKSTVPPGTLHTVTDRIKEKTQVSFYTASIPEFLKEGTAVQDTLHPDRVVIGAQEDTALSVLEELHTPLQSQIIRVAPESAQMGKYAANAYLALRIAFINQIADLCTHNGADIQEVIAVIGKDKRIGSHYWYPGLGYGGSCFPKDVKELSHYSKSVGETVTLFTQIDRLNEERIPRLLAEFSTKIGGWENKKVSVLGLSFKPNTDDLREAPSTKVIPKLLEAGAQVKGFDPQALEVAKKYFPENPKMQLADSIVAATEGADVIMPLIEWKEIVDFDFSSVRDTTKTQWFIDTRNQFSPEMVKKWGFQYIGIGRNDQRGNA